MNLNKRILVLTAVILSSSLFILPKSISVASEDTSAEHLEYINN